jgi:hypothetical protein
MEVNGDKKSEWICLDISPLFFRTVSKLFQALVVTYDEIFQSLSVEGDVLFPEPFSDPTTSTVQLRLRLLGLPLVWKTEKVVSEAGNFSLTDRQSRCPERVWKLCGKIED